MSYGPTQVSVSSRQVSVSSRQESAKSRQATHPWVHGRDKCGSVAHLGATEPTWREIWGVPQIFYSKVYYTNGAHANSDFVGGPPRRRTRFCEK